MKMKFIIDKKNDYNEHWNYCVKNDIPFVRIIPAIKFSKVEFDIFCMLDFYTLTKEPLDFFEELYKNYAEFFMLPKDKYSCAGGQKALVFTIYKEHSETFANQLFDYLNKFVKENRKPL